MNVRAATTDDAPRLAVLATQLGYPSTPEDLSRRLAPLLSSADDLVLVACDDGERVVGWLHATVRSLLSDDRHVEVVGLVVDERCRSAGWGLALLQRAEAWAAQQGAEIVRVRSNVVRERTHRFYLRAGYEITKTSHVFVKRLRAGQSLE